jgi:hypothetical protein
MQCRYFLTKKKQPEFRRRYLMLAATQNLEEFFNMFFIFMDQSRRA